MQTSVVTDALSVYICTGYRVNNKSAFKEIVRMYLLSPWLADNKILLIQEALFTHPLVTKKFRPGGEENKEFVLKIHLHKA